MRNFILSLLACGTALLLSACGGQAAGRPNDRPAQGSCISGICSNGYGTLRYPDGSEMTGNWVGGKPGAGRMDMRWPCRLDKVFSINIDANNHYTDGSAVRCGGGALGLLSGGRPTYYTGSWKTISNPFTQEQVNTYKTGIYTDANGVTWEGEFDYIPLKLAYNDVQYGKTAIRKGSFIFIGAKVDAELDEVTRGLYISEPVGPGEEIHLFRARPDYLLKLRTDYVSDRAQDASEREADARASRELFSNVATLAGTAAVVYGSYRMAIKSDRATMDSLNSVITGQQPPAAANAQLPRSNSNSARTSPKPVSVAQYRSLQNAPETGNAAVKAQTGAPKSTPANSASNKSNPAATVAGSSQTKPKSTASLPPQSPSAAAKSSAASSAAAQPAEDLDALTYREHKVAMKCLQWEGEENVPDTPCAQAVLEHRKIQCRADWMYHPATRAMYECGARYSTGHFKAYYQRLAELGPMGHW
jgi:hypothetical protein